MYRKCIGSVCRKWEEPCVCNVLCCRRRGKAEGAKWGLGLTRFLPATTTATASAANTLKERGIRPPSYLKQDRLVRTITLPPLWQKGLTGDFLIKYWLTVPFWFRNSSGQLKS